ncbi:MAG TPA: hypothetical protein VFA26_18575 [Gemmataceae bacterium]|nr:hypothetical protein [Gemmataceae bacterium]
MGTVDLDRADMEALGAAVEALHQAGDRLHAACLERLVARAVRSRQSGGEPWCFVAGLGGLVARAAAPEGATVIPVATWRCANCGSEPVLTPGGVCDQCRDPLASDWPDTQREARDR